MAAVKKDELFIGDPVIIIKQLHPDKHKYDLMYTGFRPELIPVVEAGLVFRDFESAWAFCNKLNNEQGD